MFCVKMFVIKMPFITQKCSRILLFLYYICNILNCYL